MVAIDYFFRGSDEFASHPERNDFPILMLSSAPKSGDVTYKYVFSILHQMVEGAIAELVDVRPLGQEVHSLFSDRIALAQISHAFAPGWENWSEETRANWDKIELPFQVWWGDNYIQHFRDWDRLKGHRSLNLADNPNYKVVFVVRDVFEQSFHTYLHGKNHVNDVIQHLSSKQFKVYFFCYALPYFAKLLLSYQNTKELFPGRVRFMSYERFQSEPRACLDALLDFYLGTNQVLVSSAARDFALEKSSPEALAEVEREIGGSVVGDQFGVLDENNAYAPDAWRDHLSDAEQRQAFAMLEEWGVDLKLVEDRTMLLA